MNPGRFRKCVTEFRESGCIGVQDKGGGAHSLFDCKWTRERKLSSEVRVAQDSNYYNAWFVENIDAVTFPSVHVAPRMLHIVFDFALQLWCLCLCFKPRNSGCTMLLLRRIFHGCMCSRQLLHHMLHNSTHKRPHLALHAPCKV
jgi:hypothetical protein